MKVTFKDNLLTVVTEITKEVVEGGVSQLKVSDEEHGDIYFASKVSGKASISRFGFAGNCYVGGKLAAQILEDDGTTEEQVQKKYGEALLAASQYTKQISDEASTKASSIKALFRA